MTDRPGQSPRGSDPRSPLQRAADHFSAAEAPSDDAAELWGRRIGRALALVVAIALAGLLIWQLRSL